MKYMDMDIDQSKLPTQKEVTDQLREGGSNYHALSSFREKEQDVFGHELTWRYPISDGVSLGAFIIPVQEGFLWLPYDEAAKHEGEVLLIQDARLMAADDCEVLSDDVQSYTNGLVDALGDIKVHLHSQHVTCFERQADLSFAGYLLNSGCTCPDCREQRLKRYHVTFSRKGSAMVMAANEEEARRIADATIHEDEVSWDDDWSAEYAELDKDNLD